MSAVPLRTILGQPSWSFRSSHVVAALTRLGGQLGPVMFRVGRRTIAPLSVAPWVEEKSAQKLIPLLGVLRGDFFCAPFGGNATPYRGEQHPPHGETANSPWRLESIEKHGVHTTVHASLATKIRRGRVDKFITLIDGHAVVYQRHAISGARGPMDVGHHAMVKFPEARGSGIVSTSRFVHAQVFPAEFESAQNYGYQSLKAGATFTSLERAPLAHGGTTDLSRYPARRGFEDLVMLTADPKLSLAWNAVTFPAGRYVYFALRDPRQLRHTILWISNGGRHYAPWNGRHVGVMGIEDTTSYFHFGLAESAKPNPLSRRGIPTSVTLDPKQPTVVNYIFGVAEIPAGFDRVKDIKRAADGIELIAANGKRARATVDLGFLGG